MKNPRFVFAATVSCGVLLWGNPVIAVTPQVVAGHNNTVMLRPNGTIWISGDNSFGQLGDGATEPRSVPVQVGAATDWVAVAAGVYHTVALKSDGTLWGWGDNTNGQLGLGTATLISKTPARIGSSSDWKAIAAGSYHTLALKNDGTLWGWGDSYSGQSGRGTDTAIGFHPGMTTQADPIKIGNDSNWSAIAAGAEHSMALKTDGTLWGWGSNYSTQLGDETNQEAMSPIRVGIDSDWADVITRNNQTLAKKRDGNLFGFGLNLGGQLGDGTFNNKDRPTPIGNNGDWGVVSAGSVHTVALKNDGTLWAFGDNTDGQCGFSTVGISEDSPIKIGNETDWIAVGSGERHTVAMKANGTIWTLGDNSVGQLSNADNTPRSTPTVAISPMSGDMDGNGTVDVGDALRSMRASVGLVKPSATEVISGDVGPLSAAALPTPDGAVTIGDAVVILRKVLGLVNY